MGTGHERGQTGQIGAMLTFAMLILALGTYQATVVPQQNGEMLRAAATETTPTRTRRAAWSSCTTPSAGPPPAHRRA